MNDVEDPTMIRFASTGDYANYWRERALKAEESVEELRSEIAALIAQQKRWSNNSFLDQALNEGDGVYRP